MRLQNVCGGQKCRHTGLNGTENCYLAESGNSNKAKHKVQKQSENNNCKGAVRDVSV